MRTESPLLGVRTDRRELRGELDTAHKTLNHYHYPFHMSFASDVLAHSSWLCSFAVTSANCCLVALPAWPLDPLSSILLAFYNDERIDAVDTKADAVAEELPRAATRATNAAVDKVIGQQMATGYLKKQVSVCECV